MKKWFAVISALIILISTIGFILIPNIFDTKINEKQKLIDRYDEAHKTTLRFLDSASLRWNFAYIFDSHLNILVKLNAKEEIIEQKKAEKLESAKEAASMTFNALQAVSEKHVEEFDGSEFEKLLTISSYEDSHKVYMEFKKKVGKKFFGLTLEILKLRDEIKKLSDLKQLVWYLCLLFQGMGLIFSFVSLVLKDSSNSA